MTVFRFHLKELIAEKEFKEGRRITLVEVADATDLNRMTLSKVANNKRSPVNSDVLDKLCSYFGCKVEDLITHVPDKDL